MPVSFPEYKQQVELAPVQRQQVVVNNASNAPGLDALGRGVSQFGQGMGVYNARREAAEQRERDKADQLRVRSVLAEISSGKRDFLETPLDADGNGGFLNKRGKNAIDFALLFEQERRQRDDSLHVAHSFTSSSS